MSSNIYENTSLCLWIYLFIYFNPDHKQLYLSFSRTYLWGFIDWVQRSLRWLTADLFSDDEVHVSKENRHDGKFELGLVLISVRSNYDKWWTGGDPGRAILLVTFKACVCSTEESPRIPINPSTDRRMIVLLLLPPLVGMVKLWSDCFDFIYKHMKRCTDFQAPLLTIMQLQSFSARWLWATNVLI